MCVQTAEVISVLPSRSASASVRCVLQGVSNFVGFMHGSVPFLVNRSQLPEVEYSLGSVCR